ncbi:hypothetical protein HMPREF3135_01565 [Corynebacterium sp. HMSC14H10]|nr:hypothetical protein HMPREF3135_01565 [Corynebacterium sp. HMSC14H10]
MGWALFCPVVRIKITSILRGFIVVVHCARSFRTARLGKVFRRCTCAATLPTAATARRGLLLLLLGLIGMFGVAHS